MSATRIMPGRDSASGPPLVIGSGGLNLYSTLGSAEVIDHVRERTAKAVEMTREGGLSDTIAIVVHTYGKDTHRFEVRASKGDVAFYFPARGEVPAEEEAYMRSYYEEHSPDKVEEKLARDREEAARPTYAEGDLSHTDIDGWLYRVDLFAEELAILSADL